MEYSVPLDTTSPKMVVSHMLDICLLKDLLFLKLCVGTRPFGRPSLRFKDVRKRYLTITHINTENWESNAADRDAWRLVRDSISAAEETERRRVKGKGKTGN